MINNGKMRIESANLPFNPSTKESTSSSMYTTGWNLLCYTTSSSNFNFYSYPRFSTSVITESTTNSTFLYTSNNSAIFGGKINIFSTSFSNSFQGIVHTINIQNAVYTSSSIISNFLVPTSSQYAICDYFIGMFTDLGVQDASNSFANVMYNHYSQTQQFTNSLSSTVDATNGLSFSSGQTQKITNVKVTDQRAIGVQFWIKGSFEDNIQIASIAKSPTSKGAYVKRSGNDILVKTTYSTATITFPNAASQLQ